MYDMKKNGIEGREVNNIYKFISTPILSTNVKSLIVYISSNEIWHSKYVHISNKRLELLKNYNMVNGLPDIIFNSFVCKSCMMAKQHRVPL